MDEAPAKVFLYHPTERYVWGLRRQLEQLRLRLVGSATGNATDAAWEAAESEPQLVVVLLSGGARDAIDFATTLRLEDTTEYLPVIFVGGTREEADRAQKVLPRAILAEEETLSKAVGLSHPGAGQAVLEENAWVAMSNRDLRRDKGDMQMPPWMRAQN